MDGGCPSIPGENHEGRGKAQAIVDAKASREQRETLLKIVTGEDTDPFATVFAVLATTYEEVFEPIAAPIEFDVDVEARRGQVRVEGVFDLDGEPIRNATTGDEHRAWIALLAVLLLAEKVAPAGVVVGRVVGIVLIGWGIVTLSV